MPITYPLTLPSGIASVSATWHLASAVGMLESPYSFSQQIQEHTGQRWSVDFSLPIMEPENGGNWRAFIARLRGSKGTFLFGDSTRLLPEGHAQYQLENLCGYSEDLSQTPTFGWDTVRATISADAAIAPDGLTTADKLVEDGTAAQTHLTRFDDVDVTSGINYRWSVYAKAAGRDWLYMNMGSEGFSGQTCSFNLSTGQLGTQNSDGASISSIGNSWYRCTVTGVSDATVTNNEPILFLAEGDDDPTYDGNSTDGIFFWGAQFNLLASSDIYVKTTSQASTLMAPLVNGASQTGNDLITDGWATHQVDGSKPWQEPILRAGDWIQLGSGATSRLYMVVYDVETDATGNATITVVPEITQLRGLPADDAVITYQSTKGLFRLAGNQSSFQASMPNHTSLSLSAIEAL